MLHCIPAIGLIIASAFTLVPGMLWLSGSLPVSAKKAFCSARIAVSTLTCALSFPVAETYSLLEVFWLIPATRAVAVLCNRTAEAGCFRHRRDACRNDFEAIPDILVCLLGEESDKIRINRRRGKDILFAFHKTS